MIKHQQGGGMDAGNGSYDRDSGKWKECIL